MRRRADILLVLAAVVALAGCGGNDGPAPGPVQPRVESTWRTIQEDIFEPRCVHCHTAGTSFARQSELVLTADVAYAQLVGVTPHNAAARADGQLRVGTDGLESLHKSFLWEKVNVRDQAHFFADHPQYGALMPLGEPPLTNGEIEYIRQWIVGGAPEDGEVADRDALVDSARFEPPAFQPLLPPAAGRGVQLHLGPFPVRAGTEREINVWQPEVTPVERLVERIEITMRPGSHHFILYTFASGTPTNRIPAPGVIRDVHRPTGGYDWDEIQRMFFRQFFGGTQWPYLAYSFPPGVALRMPAGTGLDLNSHYVNRGGEDTEGEVFANLHFADPGSVQHVAEVMALNNPDIELPPHRVTTLAKTFVFEQPIHVFQMFSHAHQHMTEFAVRISGGPRHNELVYFARDWQHPPILHLDPPLDLDAGQGLKVTATYDNDTDRTLRFGLLSVDEMMILFGYYYTDSGQPVAVRTAGRTDPPTFEVR